MPKRKKGFRIEKDSLGDIYVPNSALYGAQTQRAIENFPISGIKMDFPFTNSFIEALGIIKDAAARANKALGLLSSKKAIGLPFNLCWRIFSWNSALSSSLAFGCLRVFFIRNT